MPFPLDYILPRIHQFHVWQMLKLITAEQVIKCMAVGTRFIDHTLYMHVGHVLLSNAPGTELWLLCWCGISHHFFGSCSVCNLNDVHLMSLIDCHYLAGL